MGLQGWLCRDRMGQCRRQGSRWGRKKEGNRDKSGSQDHRDKGRPDLSDASLLPPNYIQLRGVLNVETEPVHRRSSYTIPEKPRRNENARKRSRSRFRRTNPIAEMQWRLNVFDESNSRTDRDSPQNRLILMMGSLQPTDDLIILHTPNINTGVHTRARIYYEQANAATLPRPYAG